MESAQNNMIEKETQQKPLEAPYVGTMRREAQEKIEGHDRSLSLIFNEINNQAIDSFGIFNSERFPGVSFSTIHLSITPELIKKINNSQDFPQLEENPSQTKDQIWFVEPAFGMGDIGNAFSALDMGIDRFIREMPKVARALKHGEKPPKVDIYIMGSPIAFGGTVTEEWGKEVGETGFDAHGKLYAEFVAKNLPQNLDDTRVVVNGPSRGSVTAERTYHFLPEEIKEHTQGLYDIPVGSHSRILPLQAVKTANMGVGMAGEFGIRILADRTSKDLGKTEALFYKQLRKIKNIPQDSKEQSGLKLKSFIAEVKALARGTPPDYDERGFYRAPELDPTNIKLEGIINRLWGPVSERRKLVVNKVQRMLNSRVKEYETHPRFIRDRGRKMVVSTSRKAHNFPWKKSFQRWESVLEYCETPTK